MARSVLGLALGLAASLAVAQDQPATAGPWTLFFDWGKAEVRGDDRVVLDQVAAALRDRPSAHLQVTGHTDRSGSRAANRRAGLARAELVRDELVNRGVARNAISTTSLGEDQLLVPTDDGVREVQNRRVVIAIEE